MDLFAGRFIYHVILEIAEFVRHSFTRCLPTVVALFT